MLLWFASWRPTTSSFCCRICATTTGRRTRHRLCSPCACASEETDEMLKLATRTDGCAAGLASAGDVDSSSVAPATTVRVEQRAAASGCRRMGYLVERRGRCGGRGAPRGGAESCVPCDDWGKTRFCW